MSSKHFSYQIYEGSFLTPPPVLDRTLNILMFRDPEENEYQIFVTRTSLEEDQTISEWCEAETENLQNNLPGFQIEGKQLTHEIGPNKLSALQVANRYLDEGNVVRQVLSIIKLPQHPRYNPDDRNVIIFTLNANQEFTEYQRKHYVKIINSFIPEVITLG
ncbi:DcrB-related protein [Enterobacteriaceae bacterium 4M9]|nr:DcrB-related protein [Enterobacteriaceae bacterium 4M9]